MSRQSQSAQRHPPSALPAHPEAELHPVEEDCLSGPLQKPSMTPLRLREPRSPTMPAATPEAGVANDPEDRGSGAESSLTELPQPMIDRIWELVKLVGSVPFRIWKLLKLPQLSLYFIGDWWRERCPGQSLREDFPQPVAFPAEEYQERLQEEPLERLVRLNVIDKRSDGMEDRPGKDVWATFDLNFKETPGRAPFILVSESIFGDAKPPGFEAYDDASNPPIPAKNADGSQMKFLGEFHARWSPVGFINGYAHQKIFLLAGKSIRSQCVLVPAGSPFDVLIGYGTIKKHKLDTAWTIANAINEQGHGQGGRRDGGSRVNHDAVKKKKPILDAHKKVQLRLQQTIEKKQEKNRKSKKTGEAKDKSKVKEQ
ncbi:hypothetical protein DIS24_g8041 [Lasiodiplodia hormozganensis]|uniref:Uncharacterized protein n=1 Tax=Lasiodiplodia hormozganensis TaxID=869390 RepID=A0AA40CNB5_9PEZI|nr:hypothetical protein DIS24_g8041 [Lasiodiplodia hormozganensis]